MKGLVDYLRLQMAETDEKFRTSLQSIMGFAELLKMEAHEPQTAKQKEFINLIHESGKNIMKIMKITEFGGQIE
ncbi:MAG: hypothetical protein E4G89_01055 [Methanothrix sp.]|nr:MAG: hypothetical protein E4G89_01055 [Methanothrix sp.]